MMYDRTSPDCGPSRLTERPQLLAPRLGEVGPEHRRVGPGRAEMVVDDVEDHPQPAPVAGVDEPLEPVGAAVRLMGREPADAVVAPVVLAVERVDRQDLDEVDAQLHEVVEPFDGRVEGAARRERADVHLVEDAAGQLPAGPGPVGPGERRVVVHPAGSVHPGRLPGRARVGQRLVGVAEQERVVGARAGRGHVARPPSRRPWPPCRRRKNRSAGGPGKRRAPTRRKQSRNHQWRQAEVNRATG